MHDPPSNTPQGEQADTQSETQEAPAEGTTAERAWREIVASKQGAFGGDALGEDPRACARAREGFARDQERRRDAAGEEGGEREGGSGSVHGAP